MCFCSFVSEHTIQRTKLKHNLTTAKNIEIILHYLCIYVYFFTYIGLF